MEDNIFKNQIREKFEKDYEKDVAHSLLANLKDFHSHYDKATRDLESDLILWRMERLLAVLKSAKISKLLSIDESQPVEEQERELLGKYHELLGFSTKGFSVVLSRDVDEIYVNKFNEEWLSVWSANLDFSPVFDFYSIITYISDYYMKDNTGTIDFLKAAMAESESLGLKEKMKVLRNVFLTHREMGQSEVLYRVVPSMHLKYSSCGEVFVNTGREKSKFLKKLSEEEAQITPNVITVADGDGLYVETSSILDKYQKRPEILFWMSPIQFAKRYTSARVKKSGQDDDEEEEDGVDENKNYKTEEEILGGMDVSMFPLGIHNTIDNDFIIHSDRNKRSPLPRQITLAGSFYPGEPRYMKLRKPLVVRYHQFKRATESHDWLFSELELYHVFERPDIRNIRNQCKENFEFCLEIYNEHIADINYVRSKTMPFANHVEESFEKAEEIVQQDNIANTLLDPQAAQDDADCEEEGNEDEENFVAYDYDKLENTYAETPDRMFNRIVLKDLETLSQQTLALDDDQYLVLEMIIDNAKKYKRALKTKSYFPQPLHLKVVGSAGTGKSHLIEIICQYVELILRSEGDDPDHPYIVKSAFTGAAACNIGGGTLHNTFALQFGSGSVSLGDKKRDVMRTVLRNLRFVVIDEFSMVPSDFLYKISRRLSEVKEKPRDIFGGVCVLMFGDPCQLKPVWAPYPWNEPKDQKHRNFNIGGSLWSMFRPVVLRTNWRQGESRTYGDLCEKIRMEGFEGLDEDDINTLKTRVYPRKDPQLPSNAVYIFATNAAVNNMNSQKLSETEGRLFTVEAIVMHKTLRNYKPFIEPSTGCIRNCSLLKVLHFKVNSEVLLCYNINTNDSLVNSSLGRVVGVKEDARGQVLEIYVHFYGEKCGKETAKDFPHLKAKYGVPTIPIKRIEVEPKIGKENYGNKSTCTVHMFPLKLAHAVTCHKVQGATFKDPTPVVMDFKSSRETSMCYVMLSRVQKLKQVYIIDELQEQCRGWRVDQSALEELDQSLKEAINTQPEEDYEIEIMCLNVRSLRKHFKEINRDVARNKRFSILCLQETWLLESDEGQDYQLENFNCDFNSRGFGKGIATYYKETFKIKESVCSDHCQLSILTSNHLNVVNVYRSEKCKNLCELLKTRVDMNIPSIICGDFNMNYQDGNNKISRFFKDTMNFNQLVDQPTHDEGSLLDQVWISEHLNDRVSVKQTSVRYSDHDMLTISISQM